MPPVEQIKAKRARRPVGAVDSRGSSSSLSAFERLH
jgi:hypothetical protein